MAEADKFKAAGATILFVYPGPSKNLSERAKEFVRDKTIPEHSQFLVDPDYSFTNAYHLRWDVPKETAYPSTFIIQKDRPVTIAKVSDVHGGRTAVDEILKAATASQ